MFSNHESKARIANWDKNSSRKSEYWLNIGKTNL